MLPMQASVKAKPAFASSSTGAIDRAFKKYNFDCSYSPNICKVTAQSKYRCGVINCLSSAVLYISKL